MQDRSAAPRDPGLPDDPVGLRWSPLGRRDLDDLSVLLTAIELLDEPSERHSLSELGESFAATSADAAHRSMVGREAGGTAVAYGWNQPTESDLDPRRVYLNGGVHPGWRSRGVGRALFDWQLRNARAWYRGTHTDEMGPLRLITYLDEKLTAQRRLHERAGLQAVRWYADMVLHFGDGGGDVPAHQAPVGIRVVPFSHKHSEAVRQAHNEAFSDHWGSQPVDPVRWSEQLNRSASRPQWSWVALDAASSEVAGYAMSSVYEQDWVAQGFSDGWTDRLGVRRKWRGRGVAKALLTASMRSFSEAGLSAAGLGVDSDNPSGAFHLYERLGYVATDTMVMYARTEPVDELG